MPFQSPRGTRDFYPEEMAVRRHIEAAWRSASIDFGFDEIDGPTFEHLELYTVKSGDGIVSELFSFTRHGGESTYALRPEFTPTLARMIAAKGGPGGGTLPTPTKWFTMPSFFRAERPQRGRLREFLQWNVDLVGLDTPEADAEVIAVALTALQRLGLTSKDVQVRLSHRGVIAEMAKAVGFDDECQTAALTMLDKWDRMDDAKRSAACVAARLDPAKVQALHQKLAAESVRVTGRDIAESQQVDLDGGRRSVADMVAKQSLDKPMVSEPPVLPGDPGSRPLDDLVRVEIALTDAGFGDWITRDFGIVRGLAYYTGTVFEIHETGGAERAVAGGGRYDGLVELFGGPPTPAFGFGMGDVVLGLLLKDRGLLGGDGGTASLMPTPDAFIISTGGAADAELAPLVAKLRAANLHVRHSYRATRNVGKLLGEAAKSRARCAVILGAELADGMVGFKDLASGEQRTVEVGEEAKELEGAIRSLRLGDPG